MFPTKANGKTLLLGSAVGNARAALLKVRVWNPSNAPVTLRVPGRGLLRVHEPAVFALNCAAELDLMLTGAEGPNGFSTAQLLDLLKALGCECYIEPITEAGSEN